MQFSELFLCENDLPKTLSKEETIELFIQVKEGSIEARNQLIIHNIRLVRNEVERKFCTFSYDLKELFSIGIIGLIKAIMNFDYTKGYEFSTYAGRCIDNEILMFLRKIKTYENRTFSLESIVVYNDDRENLTLEAQLYDEHDMVEDYENKELHQAILQCIQKMDERNREIMMLFFGFYQRPYMEREIAELFHLSQSYVSRIIRKNVKLVARELESMGLIELPASSYLFQKRTKKF